jgi:hypothetical protein
VDGNLLFLLLSWLLFTARLPMSVGQFLAAFLPAKLSGGVKKISATLSFCGQSQDAFLRLLNIAYACPDRRSVMKCHTASKPAAVPMPGN